MDDCADMISLIKKICESPRFTGSKGSENAREVISSGLKTANYGYTTFSTAVPNWSISEMPKVRFLAPEKIEINGFPAILSLPTPAEGISGKLVGAGSINMLDSFDWEKYAIVDESNKTKGYLISTSYGSPMQPLPFDSEKLPYVILSPEILEKIHVWIQSGSEIIVQVRNPAKIDGTSEVISIVTEEPQDQGTSRPYPFICAHYDTVFGTVGAHDNASGVAVALKLAELLSKDKKCRFAFFDGEEINKAGSTDFAAKEKQSLKNISFVLEIDAVGNGNEIALLCSKPLYKKLQNLEGSFKENLPEKHKVTISRQSKIGFSDVWSFMKEEVPVIRMFTRGGCTREIMHAPEDTTDKIDEETLSSVLKVSQIIAMQLFK